MTTYSIWFTGSNFIKLIKKKKRKKETIESKKVSGIINKYGESKIMST